MGEPSDPTEPDYEDGASCVTCEDDIFDGHTPKYVKVKIEGVESCPPAPPMPPLPDGILRQRALNPCAWEVEFWSGGWFWRFDWNVNNADPIRKSFLTLTQGGVPIFEGRSTETCEHNFSNAFTCAIEGWSEEGTGCVRWGPEIDEAAYDAQFP